MNDSDEMPSPFLAVGNDELGDAIREGDMIPCPKCKKEHPVLVGTDTATGKKSNMVMFFKCKKKLYLTGIAGKAIRRNR